MGVSVEVDSASGEARPRTVCFGARRVAVLDVLDRWHGHNKTWWKVATAEGEYVLMHDETRGAWDLAAVVAGAPRDDAWPAPRKGPAH